MKRGGIMGRKKNIKNDFDLENIAGFGKFHLCTV